MRRHHRTLSPLFAKGLAVVLFALCVAAWYSLAEKNPAHASAGDTVPQSVQKGVNFLTPDVVNWTRQNSCIACHRQGASLYGLANAKSRGYSVDTSKATGLGFIAQKVNDEQQPDGRWTHFGAFNYAKTSYAFFGMAGYDKFVGTEYSRSLVSAANWAVNNQTRSGTHCYWIEDHGLFPTTHGNVPVTARMMVGVAQAKQRVDSATAALYQQHLDRAAAWLRASRDGIYGDWQLAYTFQVAYGLIGLKASGAANDDPDVALYRDRLLAAASQPTGRGWGYTAGHGADEFNTGIALYALGRVGIKPRTNQTVRDAINWLRDQQVDVAGTDHGYWRGNNFSSLDIPTTFAILGLSGYGDLGVELSLASADRQVIRSNFPQPQAVTYLLSLTNDGAFDATDTYSLHVEGGLPGWTAAVEPSSVTLPSGQSSPVLLTVTAPPGLPEALPVEMTVIATSDTDPKISANVKVTTYTDPPPPTDGDPTQIVFVEGANATVTSRRAVQPLAARVKDATTNAVVHGPGRGVTTFYVAGIAIGTDVDADGDGVFRLDWLPGEAWAATGAQDLRAVYSGIDLPDPQVDLLPSFAASTIDLDLTERQPSIQAGGPYGVQEGGGTVLTAAGGDLGGGRASYAWDLDNDGTFETAGQSVSFSAAGLNGPGSYPVRAQVVTTAGRQASAQTVVNVQNVPPVLVPPGQQTAAEGSPASFDLGWLSDPGPDSPWAVNVDWGDGSPSTTFNPAAAGPLGTQPHAYADSGLYTVTLRAADKDGATDTKAFKVKVFNVAPAVSAPPDQPAEAGVARSFDLGAFTDPGPDNVWAADIDWGDASAHTTFNPSAPGALAAQTHTYSANGNYTVTVRVTDKDGGVGSAAFKVAADHIAVVRHALRLTGGRVEGTMRQLLGENGALGGSVFITSDVKVPGVPSVRIDGSPAFGGTVEGAGGPEPSNYQLTVSGNATLGGRLVTRTDPVELPPLAAPPAPDGTRDVILRQAGQGLGNPATLRNLTLTGNAGRVAVPPGTYGQFSADGQTTLLLGRANSAQPAVYNLRDLRLNGGALRLAGPVIINVANKVILDGSAVMGAESASRWLKLNVVGDGKGVDGDVSVRGGSALYALVHTPLGRITVGGNNSMLRGAVACDYLDVSGSSILHLLGANDAAQTTNKPPDVNAGPDQAIALPSSEVTLNGTVTDDGLPAGGTLSASWVEVSGPGPVIFSRADAASTRAAFAEPGTYVLRLRAHDSLSAGSDDVSVNVGLDDQAPIVNAGMDREIFLPVSSTTLSGVVLDDGLPANGALSAAWSKVSGPGAVTFSRPRELVTDAAFGTPGTYVLRLTASDGQLTGAAEVTVKVSAINQAPVVDAGPDQRVVLPGLANLQGVVADDGLPEGNTLVVAWTKVSGPGTVTFNNAGDAVTTASFGEPGSYLLQLSAGDTQFTTSSTVLVTVRPPNQPPTVSAGPSQTITLPDGANLRGMVSDDGLPAANALTASWAKVSGPGEVTFGNPNEAVTTAAFDRPGAYVLRLTAGDSLLTSSADVTITVNPAAPTNQAPAVNAGPDQTVVLPAQASLDGTVSDDGLPADGTVSAVWSVVSGPGGVTFSNPGRAVTSAAFGTQGTYVLRLTATDSQLTGADELVVTVQEAPPVNKPPTVNAGPAQTVTLPHAANLVGAVVDDGLPAAGSLTAQWVKVSGPGSVVFSAPGRVTTAAAFGEAGTYVLRLTASDSELSASGEVTVTVNGPNRPPTVNAGPDLSVVGAAPATLRGEVKDDGLPGDALSVSWSVVSVPGNVSFGNPNGAVTTAAFGEAGTYVLRLTASDSELSASDDVVVTVEPAGPPPAVSIDSLPDGAEVTTRVNVVGSVSAGSNWRLEYGPGDGSGAAWTTLGSGGTPVAGGLLGVFDPTLLLNGTYTLRLVATDSAAQTTVTSVSLLVTGEQKLGHFGLSFIDLDVPVAGIPMQVTRTYDSRDKRVGDFGVGWTLGVRNVRVEKSGLLGAGWEQTQSGGFIPTYCLRPTRPHFVTVTFPNGKVYKFAAVTNPQCSALTPVQSATVRFAPLPGTHGTLAALGDNDVLVTGDAPGAAELRGFDTLEPYDPTRFLFSTQDGTAFVIDQRLGVRSVTDANGNTLTVGADGITHSSGKSVTFTRDAQGRITQITDPAGNALTYGYDAAGDLVSFTDREGRTTAITYNSTHGLLSLRDPRGVRPVRNEYDDSGRLVRQVDAFDKVVNFAHDLDARQEVVTDRTGRTTAYEYDARGRVVRVADAAGGVTLRDYDDRDNLLSETDELGKATTYTYDAQDNLVGETDPLGHTTRYSYNARGQVLSVTDALGRVTAYTYDANGNLTRATDALGHTTSAAYDARGLPTSVTDGLGRTVSFEYDAAGNLTRKTDALGRVTTFDYDANGNEVAETAARTVGGAAETLTSTYLYDRQNRPTRVTLPDGSTVETTYGVDGNPAAFVDQLGHRTAFDFDEMGRHARTTFPDGTKGEVFYDAEGRRTKVLDRAGRATSYTYDALGRLEKTTAPGGASTSLAYNAAGLVVASVDARGNTTRYEYDDAGRQTKVIDAQQHATTFAYDAVGNRTSVTDAKGQTTRYEYDDNRRLTKVVFPDGASQTSSYDPAGRLTARTDQAGRVTRFEYDAGGRLTAVTNALGGVTRYAYDELGNLLTQTDANNHTTAFEYDRAGRRVRRTLPGGRSETYGYDAGGRLVSLTDFRGKRTSFAYDELGLLLSRTPDPSLGEPAVAFTYTGAGERATMADASGTTAYTYDAAGRLASKQTPQGTLSYTYDAAGNLLTVRSSRENGVSTSYAYDTLNRLTTVTDHRSAGGVTSYTYDANGGLTSASYPNGVQTAYVYDSRDRLTGMSAAAGGAMLAGYDYTLDAAGSRLAATERGGRSVAYTYDALHRLTEETIGAPAGAGGRLAYTLDAVGNRLTRVSTVAGLATADSSYDADDRPSGDAFDPNGNTAASGGMSYGYDFENRLTGVNGGEVRIVYDGDGNRVAKTVGGVTTRYLVDTDNLTGHAQVVEESQGGAVVRQYTYGLDLVSQRQTTGGGGWQTSFYGYDGQGSVRYLTGAAGEVTDTYDYDAFGNLLARTGGTPNDYLYRGEQFDPSLGLYYLRARYMNPGTGRFHTADAFEGTADDPASLHKYLYADADPVNNTDPSGFSTIGELNAAESIRLTLASLQSFNGQLALGFAQSTSDDADLSAYADLSALTGGELPPFVPDPMAFGGGFLEPFTGRGRSTGRRTRGYISADRTAGGGSLLRTKLRQARTPTGRTADAEIRAAKAFRARGENVHFMESPSHLPMSEGGRQGERSSDFLVGGAPKTGAGGVKYDVFSPESDSVNNLVGRMRRKLSQSDRIVLDLTHTKLRPGDLKNLYNRVNNAGGKPASRPLKEVLILFGDEILGTLKP